MDKELVLETIGNMKVLLTQIEKGIKEDKINSHTHPEQFSEHLESAYRELSFAAPYE